MFILMTKLSFGDCNLQHAPGFTFAFMCKIILNKKQIIFEYLPPVLLISYSFIKVYAIKIICY